jgi:hypothetical protein
MGADCGNCRHYAQRLGPGAGPACLGSAGACAMDDLKQRLEKHVKRLEELAGPEHKATRQRIYRSIGKIKEALSKVSGARTTRHRNIVLCICQTPRRA